MGGLYSFLFAIAGVIIYAPLVWHALHSLALTLLTSAAFLLTAPLMWCVDFMHDRKLNSIKAELEKAMEENQSKAAIYILEMRYHKYEERRDKILMSAIFFRRLHTVLCAKIINFEHAKLNKLGVVYGNKTIE